MIKGGIYLFDLLMEYAANTSMIVVGFFEVYVVAYLYGKFHFLQRKDKFHENLSSRL